MSNLPLGKRRSFVQLFSCLGPAVAPELGQGPGKYDCESFLLRYRMDFQRSTKI